MTQTNEAALQLIQLCQSLRLRAGELDPNGRAVDLGDFYLLPGDEIVTRHNNRQLLTDRGDMVRNRSTWTIDVIHRDGSLTVTGDGGRVHLPVDYVAEHVELGYARTAMGGGQGRTVTTGLLYLEALATSAPSTPASPEAPTPTKSSSAPPPKRPPATSSNNP